MTILEVLAGAVPFSAETEYDRLADVVEAAVSWTTIRKVIGIR